VQGEQGTFLLLQDGNVQRHPMDERDPTIVVFERYAFDLSRLAGTAQPLTEFLVREHYTWELLWPKPRDPARFKQPGNFRAEMHDRIVAPLYPVALMIVTLAYLGAPRTTRQSRTLSMVSAIGAVAALRVIGFTSMVLGISHPAALALQYVALIAAAGLGLIAIAQGAVIEPPAFVVRAVTAVTERLARRFATT
jgi:lipopolysaccharide export system permease protein